MLHGMSPECALSKLLSSLEFHTLYRYTMTQKHNFPSNNKDTLHLPRILCLHGGGTNARIFRAQCRALEKALRTSFRLCYAEALFPSQPGPDVTAVYRDFGPFRAWIDSPDANPVTMTEALQISICKAIMEDDQRGATGPVVGLLGFSQGAKVCASLILEQQLLGRTFGDHSHLPFRLPQWRFAVLLAGRGPLVTLSHLSVGADIMQKMAHLCENDDSSGLDSQENLGNVILTRELIQVPTIHVHGRKDPALDLHRKLYYDDFDPRYSKVMEWDGAHRVPLKSKDVATLVKEINVLWASVSHSNVQG
ncbi:conserved hypothetical protein [Talaromyces stipitatus ATCC 10500]|uniref:Esterase tropF n=1 Tax=Talaromyces stipitatus (strain ATCC 10500 / CBS 375.48 / QM 6759 / NRRL 1006) TaxID=441959 RepID=TROPF_TALSN|nr:uncharacterized protein TSTA_117780 [Talaromyces stipitatus ATCC 10500]B8M9K3.1 RecName: Full=Esterase tropF; AltName: Full=Tropolone synthesis protein F [Talaromyces stipitatus ATCC 10500]EED18005.1 conserved hypothetical protein [Talaromyces stipitatus ATCC 10500]DAA64707.1 TPA_exp: TSR3 [Talaromyces stipitatus ATCC 10500]